jgi:hypothetical protein
LPGSQTDSRNLSPSRKLEGFLSVSGHCVVAYGMYVNLNRGPWRIDNSLLIYAKCSVYRKASHPIDDLMTFDILHQHCQTGSRVSKCMLENQNLIWSRLSRPSMGWRHTSPHSNNLKIDAITCL